MADESGEPRAELDAEFRRLFWAARKAHRRLKGDAAANDPDHLAAVEFARSHGWMWAERLLEASRRNVECEVDPAAPEGWHGVFHFVHGTSLANKGNHEAAIEAYRKALDDPSFGTPGKAWGNVGNALAEKGDHNGAIQAYRKALDDPSLDTPGDAWHNLGNSLVRKGDHNGAIQAYRKALDDPNYGPPGDAWVGIGASLHIKRDHDGAIEAYRKALDDPSFDTPGKAWNNIGLALSAKGEHDGAIEAYRKALDDPNYGTPAKAWNNIADAYVKTGNREEAEKAFRSALESLDPAGAQHARARLGLRLLESRIKPEALSPDDRALVAKPAVSTETGRIEEGIIAAIREAGDTQYDKYLSDRKDSGRDDTLSILRGWSSAVTLLEGSERRWRGGGYFLKWRGYGVAIDPGFDFLRNFHDAGYHGREISAVVVSHNHPDHNSELKDVDDLRYELYKRLATTGDSGGRPYLLLWDEDTARATDFGSNVPEHRAEPIVMASGFPHPIDLSGPPIPIPARVPVRVTPFKVNHGSDVPRAMGMTIELLDEDGGPALRIGYTADTAYFPELQRHLAGCDVLIAHISQPGIDELQDATKLKEVHLGYRGTAKLLGECKPKLALIGEFWAGFADLRIRLAKGLRERSGVEHVLPAGLAMHVRLPSLEIECTECHKPTPFRKVRTAPPTDHFGSLAYLCPGCMI